jgi:hypothetical protein
MGEPGGLNAMLLRSGEREGDRGEYKGASPVARCIKQK